jgi:hypothetical protein
MSISIFTIVVVVLIVGFPASRWKLWHTQYIVILMEQQSGCCVLSTMMILDDVLCSPE